MERGERERRERVRERRERVRERREKREYIHCKHEEEVGDISHKNSFDILLHLEFHNMPHKMYILKDSNLFSKKNIIERKRERERERVITSLGKANWGFWAHELIT